MLGNFRDVIYLLESKHMKEIPGWKHLLLGHYHHDPSLELSTHIVGIVGAVGHSRSFMASCSLLNILLSAFYYSSKGLKHKSYYITELKK
jgi:hypothetical protein